VFSSPERSSFDSTQFSSATSWKMERERGFTASRNADFRVRAASRVDHRDSPEATEASAQGSCSQVVSSRLSLSLFLPLSRFSVPCCPHNADCSFSERTRTTRGTRGEGTQRLRGWTTTPRLPERPGSGAKVRQRGLTLKGLPGDDDDRVREAVLGGAMQCGGRALCATNAATPPRDRRAKQGNR
jgi:hypothetical protein